MTGTVPAQRLIVGSNMSKKLAESLDRLVLDVKFGSGAFMKTRTEAESLARAMVSVGTEMGVRISHLLSPMDEPLGRAVGNALEVAEAVEVLQGGGPDDVRLLTLDLAERVAFAKREELVQWLDDGSAWRKFVALVEAQEGDATVLESLTETYCAPIIEVICAPSAGSVASIDAGEIGRGCVALGAGRARMTDGIDFAVGCTLLQKIGAQVEKGDPVIRLHARDQSSLDRAKSFFDRALRIE